MKKEDKKQEEARYPVGEEGLLLGGQRNKFSDFELKHRVEKLTEYLKGALEETINLQNMVYWHLKAPDENKKD